MNNNIATNNGTNEENNTFFSVWVILRGWIAATVLVLMCVIAGVALSARSLNDFPYPHPGYAGGNSEAYNTKDYGGMLNAAVDPPTSSPSWIQSYTHQGMYSNGTHANVFTAATVLTNSDPTLLFTNNDDDHNDNGSNQENNDDDDDDHEIEYIAVIGWYAIMIGIVFCVIPTLMAIYQRRIRRAENNARDEMQTNIRVIQNRMNDIEAQQQQQQQVQRHNSYHVQDDDNVTTFLTATENHDCTWDYLEGLFAATTTTPAVTPRNSANNDAAFIGNNGSHGLVGRRRHLMNDILLGVSAIDFIRGHVEKELAKRRDCRRRLLAALKLYSMKISECHLISIGDEEEEDGGGGGKIRLLTTPRRDGIEDGYIKSGTAPIEGNTSDDSKNGESNIVDDIVINVGCDNVNDEVVVNKMASSETDKIVVSEGAKINTNINDNTRSNLVAAETEEDGVSNSQQLDEEIGQCLQLADVVSKSPQLMSLPSFKSRKDSPNVVVNNVNGTDIVDDDDNNYSALLIPCTSTASSSENTLTRTVIPTCAICLAQYKPGNYVTWSSNDECCHAFHRDCILIWLLKKDASNGRSRRNNGGSNDGEDGEFGGSKYLCPCCRGEFVSNTLLKEIVDAETTASSTPTTAI